MQLSVDLTVTDVEASATFYRALGLDVPDVWAQEGVAHHVEIQPGFMLNSQQLTRSYAPDAVSVVLIFEVGDRDAVDAKHAELAAAGYTSAVEPFDAFWGSRYAIVDDPDGNRVGLMSPQDQAHQAAPTL